ncbi:hypothetical protein SBRCBS47491_002922 [Sporothrix bragantina]|uniref:Zn(2)-C6 fungal-type domain-containing protein n=1 Tax=Sporothrix bragantina TaxID=671064 RepID=A0ABP0BAZ8_9PEZI
MADATAPFRVILPAPGRASKLSGDETPEDTGSNSSPVSNQRKLLKRIRSVAQACQMCRQMKAKCDGGRPRCGHCIDRDRPCGYEGEAGQSRQAAMRARLAAFESVFVSLRTANPVETERLIQRLRTMDDPVAILREEISDSPSLVSNVSTSGPTSSAATSANTQQTSPGTSPRVSPGPSNSGVSGADRSRNTSPRQSVERLLNNDSHTVIAPVAIELVFPDFLVTTRAVSEFYDNQGPLFQVFSQEETKSFLDIVFGGPALGAVNSDEKKLAMSCLAAVAAVGMRFSSRSFDLFTSNAVYDIAKQFFDLALERSPFLAIKIAALLALYNLMNRNPMALIWINTGLRLSQTHDLCNKTPNDASISLAEWTRHRKTWRTLVFLSCWLSFAMCLITGQEVEAEKINPVILDFDTTGDIREIIQMESAKIAILKVEVLRIHLTFKKITVLSFESVTRDLQSWYDKLPHSIHLRSLEHNSSLPPDVLRSAYHLHLLYMGAILLIYRRMASQYGHVANNRQSGQPFLGDGPEAVPLSLLKQGIEAARTSASICSLLLQDDPRARRSWIVILQAYSAGIVLLHAVAQKQVYGCHPDTWQGDMRRAEVCLNVLSQNSAADGMARELYNKLAPFYGEFAQTRAPFDHDRHGPNNGSPNHGYGHGYIGHNGHNGHNGYNGHDSHGHESQETVSLFLTLPTGVPMERTRMPRELLAMLGQPFHSLQNEKGNRNEGRTALDAANLELPQIAGLRW